jgi:hypothetical protein
VAMPSAFTSQSRTALIWRESGDGGSTGSGDGGAAVAAEAVAAAPIADDSAAAIVAAAPAAATSGHSGASTAEEAASKSTRPMLHCRSAWRSESPRSEVLSSVTATPTLVRPCRAREAGHGVRHAQREARAIAATGWLWGC